ncbi:SGNH/GDSL hydrolase family protein [Spirosoma taeanense]|uniref:SGNH/GDSL hydrolase family protein n=1 Tax=Spirosoma taeanense TaxID=2735870 RepID=A0A6M5Y4V3_9BACT|nr:SGNH/GDSL hydrolase family protein [Spirosoma taeanense]QJW88839.1 SGNH/GDSL hydrolase family protein [Spirosoma taeanense]
MQVDKRFRWWLIIATLVGMAACNNNDIDPNAAGLVPLKGTADFTKYVAVGNSLTAGYADNGLYREGQLKSYPNILAGQFKTVGGGDFIQPLFTEVQANGSGYVRLIRVPTPATLATSIVAVAPGAARGGTTTGGAPLLTPFTSANQNLGVPGIRMSDIQTPGYGSTQGNPYFERFVSTAPATTYLQYVGNNLNGATFFSCWLGNNDALGYAVSGGVSPMTETAPFTTNFTAMINKLTENNRKGVVIGIPNITTAPFFTTYTIPLVLTTVNAVVKPATPITALVVQTPGGIRATQTGDLLMLANVLEYAKIGSTTAGTRQGPYGLSALNPLPTQLVLDAGEVTALNARIAEYNSIMKAQADVKGLVYIDPNTILGQLTSATGLVQNGITYSSTFVQGGVYSLDGLHLTPAGYALMSNEIIKGINSKYGSTIPQVNPAAYRRVLLQQE